MISVLIPVFNTVIYPLAKTISYQLASLGIEGEIIIADDFSTPIFRTKNRMVAALPAVKYIELNRNLGRQKIRGHLADIARYDWLLFLDGDSSITKNDFLLTYWQHMNKPCQVLIGGRTYSQQKPSTCSKTLHWKYGKARENIFRKRTGFMTNNFCIKKKLFLDIAKTSRLQGYGHEDTLIGIRLEEVKATICIIENAVLHQEIEETEIFLQKTKNALQNLLKLSTICKKSVLQRHVRLFYWFAIIRKFHLDLIFIFIYKIIQKPLEKNLCSCNPSLLGFDFYRLNQLFLISRNVQ